MRVAGDFFHRLEIKRLWDGRPVPLGLKRRLVREYERFEMVNRQIEQVLAERAQELEMSCTLDVQKVRQLLRLRGVGITSAWLSVMEFFAWRNFRNRRQVGALAVLPQHRIRVEMGSGNETSASRAIAIYSIHRH